jgi:hypothetical protein
MRLGLKTIKLERREVFWKQLIAILIGIRWNLSIVLICPSFIVKAVEHFFMYLLVICSYCENSLFNSSVHIFNWIIYSFGASFF